MSPARQKSSEPSAIAASIVDVIIGIAIFGFTVATFSSAMTVSQLHAPAILGPDDLTARPVAVIAGTRDRLPGRRSAACRPLPVESLGEAVTLLKEGQVDAVVHDTPLLRYYLKNNPDSRLALAPRTFEIFTYGINLPGRAAHGGRNSIFCW